MTTPTSPLPDEAVAKVLGALVDACGIVQVHRILMARPDICGNCGTPVTPDEPHYAEGLGWCTSNVREDPDLPRVDPAHGPHLSNVRKVTP